MSERIAIIAALDREIAPLVREGHGFRPVEAPGFSRAKMAATDNGALAPDTKAYRGADTLVLVAGIGGAAAARATRAVIAAHDPALVVSAGFAGALTPRLRVGDVLVPSAVRNAATGEQFPCAACAFAGQGGEATLVTATSVLSRDAKAALTARFSADAVDMEAAAVAAVARDAGVPFAAVKVISDPFDFDMPPLDRFVDASGKLHLLQLIVYAVPRPRLWGALARLGRNSARAAQALAGALAELSARHPAPVK
jgi:adenosylhomocysteine nucleosidase